ncbi:MAG: hypothetical protein IJP44_14175 [Bacteroidales bacterium]|nr:hypothetical protein [Bacteroidales bacterium]
MTETNRIEFKRELTRELDLEREVVAFLNYREGGIMRIYGRKNFEFGGNYIRMIVPYNGIPEEGEAEDGDVVENVLENVVGNVLENNNQLTERQVKILYRLVDTSKKGIMVNDTINDTINDTENAGTLSAYFNVSIITIKRDLSVLQKLGYIRHDGPNKGGRWLILKTEK